MALRIKETACLILMSAGLAGAQELTFTVRHQHWHKGAGGTLSFDQEGVRWDESGKKADHSREWKYADVQRLELAPDHVRIQTYEDAGWQFGRDREYFFDHLPPDLAVRVYPFLIAKLDQRFAAHVADSRVLFLFEMPAKLLFSRSGSSGSLKIGADLIVFDGGEHGESRSWRYTDISSVSSSEPFDLTLVTIEGENRLQLKQALGQDRYNEIWRRISEANGLR